MSTLKPVRSLFIWRQVPPQAIPDESAICSSGLVPSIAAASSMTASSIMSHAITLIALTARSPGVSPTPRPAGGKTAPGFMNSPRTFNAWA